jgi:site-specific recombinase XerC
MPRIQTFLDFERHITISSRTRFAQAWLGHVSLATTSVYAEVDLVRQAKGVGQL